MATASRKQHLETRTERRKLKVRHNPYWVKIGKGLGLGYRNGKNTGAWVVRFAGGERLKSGAIKYVVTTLEGIPDDYEEPDGQYVLDYFEAQEAARRFAAGEREKDKTEVNTAVYSVGDALDNYVEDYTARSGKHTDSLTGRIDKNIRPKLGSKVVEQLKQLTVKQWHRKLSQTDSDDPEIVRKRKVNANKNLAMLKAALNLAYSEGRVLNVQAWQSVKPFRNVEAPKIRFLSQAEIARLINACEPDFRRLVRGALLTGCRYGELIRAQVSEYDDSNGSLHVPFSKSGKSRHVPLTDEGREFFKQLTIGKPGGGLIFTHIDGGEWKKNHQAVRMQEACKIAKIEPRISFHILRHCYAASLAKKGVALPVISAALGHSDSRVTEKHYSHLAPSHVADVIRANLPEIGLDDPDNVVPLSADRS